MQTDTPAHPTSPNWWRAAVACASARETVFWQPSNLRRAASYCHTLRRSVFIDCAGMHHHPRHHVRITTSINPVDQQVLIAFTEYKFVSRFASRLHAWLLCRAIPRLFLHGERAREPCSSSPPHVQSRVWLSVSGWHITSLPSSFSPRINHLMVLLFTQQQGDHRDIQR